MLLEFSQTFTNLENNMFKANSGSEQKLSLLTRPKGSVVSSFFSGESSYSILKSRRMTSRTSLLVDMSGSFAYDKEFLLFLWGNVKIRVENHLLVSVSHLTDTYE